MEPAAGRAKLLFVILETEASAAYTLLTVYETVVFTIFLHSIHFSPFRLLKHGAVKKTNAKPGWLNTSPPVSAQRSPSR